MVPCPQWQKKVNFQSVTTSNINRMLWNNFGWNFFSKQNNFPSIKQITLSEHPENSKVPFGISSKKLEWKKKKFLQNKINLQEKFRKKNKSKIYKCKSVSGIDVFQQTDHVLNMALILWILYYLYLDLQVHSISKLK